MIRSSFKTFIRDYSKKSMVSKADKLASRSAKNTSGSKSPEISGPLAGRKKLSTSSSLLSSSSTSNVIGSNSGHGDQNSSSSSPNETSQGSGANSVSAAATGTTKTGLRTKSAGLKAFKSNLNNHNNPAKPVNFIPFKKFPKIPEEIQSKSTEEIYESIYLKPMDLPRPNLINFEIPKQYSKEYIKSQLTTKDKAMIDQLDTFMNTQDDNEMLQSQLNLIKLYYDKDSFNYKLLPEHPLKKSLSGMINLNHNLDDIDDEYLWNLIPQDKLFGKRFFEGDKDALFKQWEAKIIEKNNQLNESIKMNEVEINKFLKLFNENKTFLVKKNGRFKLNKQLLKNYKRLRAKGNLPFKLNKHNLDLDFDIEFEIENNDLKLKK